MPVRAWYDVSGSDPAPVRTLLQLKQSFAETPGEVSVREWRIEAARLLFTGQVQAITQTHDERLQRYSHQYKATLRAKARRLLEKAALIEIALGQQRTLFDDESYPVTFGEAAVAGLQRHKSPWSWMLVIGGKPLPRPRETDPFWGQIPSVDRARLKDVFRELTEEAKGILSAWRTIRR